MPTYRMGVSPHWLRSWEERTRTIGKGLPDLRAANDMGLERYAISGATGDKALSDVTLHPPLRSWERFLDNYLTAHASALGHELETSGIATVSWNAPVVAHCFAAAYTGMMIEHNKHALFPTRFSGRTLAALSMHNVPYVGLGLISGARKEALSVANLQIQSYRAGFFFDGRYYPLFAFMLRVLAGYLSQPPIEATSEAQKEPILDALFDVWRAPRPEVLTELCLAACDLHTHMCELRDANEYCEFDRGMWMRIPIEILLVFKLRELLGLENPTIEHPLMAKPFGELPPEIGFRADDLVTRVRDRMRQDGFDEQAIVALYN